MPLDPALFAAFLLAAWVLILIPGPDMLFLLGQTLAGGPRRGLAAMGGMFTGAMVHVALATAGIAAVVAASPLLFAGVQALGAAYLLWLGVGALLAAWRGGGTGLAVPGAAGGDAPGSVRAAYWQGLLTNLTNPKVALFFMAFLPQFVAPDRAAPWVQMLIMGPLVPLMSVACYALLILGAGRVRARLAAAGSRALRWLDGIAGGMFLALGLRLAAQVATGAR